MKFSGEWPEGIRALVEPVFRQGEWLIPSWYSPEKVNIFYEAYRIPENSMLTAKVEYAYKMACIWVYPSFLSEPPEQQLEAVYHEFFHLSVNPTFDLALDILERACGEDSATYKILKAQAVVLLEQSVSDLACALRKHEQAKTDEEEWPKRDEAPAGRLEQTVEDIRGV